MTALPAACFTRLCFTSVFLPPNLSVSRASGVSILLPQRSWHLSPAWQSISRWPRGVGEDPACLLEIYFQAVV